MTAYIVHVSNKSDFHGVYTDPEKAKLECFLCNEQDPFRYFGQLLQLNLQQTLLWNLY